MSGYDSTIVPTPRTRDVARMIVRDAASQTGPDAVLAHLRRIEGRQVPALLGLLADIAAGNPVRVQSEGKPGRPSQRGLALACPTCDAEPWQPCRAPSGWASRPHAARQGKRCANCKAPIASGRFDYCTPECRVELRKRRDREYQRRRRQGEK